jgi:hypothetical protein
MKRNCFGGLKFYVVAEGIFSVFREKHGAFICKKIGLKIL